MRIWQRVERSTIIGFECKIKDRCMGKKSRAERDIEAEEVVKMERLAEVMGLGEVQLTHETRRIRKKSKRKKSDHIYRGGGG